MTLNVVPAQLVAGSKRQLDVDPLSGLDVAQRGASDRLRDRMECNVAAVQRRRGEATAVDRHRVTGGGTGGGMGRAHDERTPAGCLLGIGHYAELANDSGEHEPNGN